MSCRCFPFPPVSMDRPMWVPHRGVCYCPNKRIYCLGFLCLQGQQRDRWKPMFNDFIILPKFPICICTLYSHPAIVMLMTVISRNATSQGSGKKNTAPQNKTNTTVLCCLIRPPPIFIINSPHSRLMLSSTKLSAFRRAYPELTMHIK